LASKSLSYSSKIVLLPGYLARFFVLGEFDAPPLLLLPDVAGGMDLSLPIASRLSQQFCVYVLQPRGEDVPYDLTNSTKLEDLGQDVIDFQKALGLERPLLCGLGFGAITALHAVQQYPGRFAGAVVQGLAPGYDEALQCLGESMGRHSLFEAMLGNRWMLPQLRQMIEEHCQRTDMGVVARRLRLMSQFEMESIVCGVRQAPLLIQTATNDTLVTPEAWKPWRRVLPRMTLQTIDNAGHFAYLTHGEVLASQVERFANRRLGVPMQLPAV
jgi:pimeloyl-ACP methyl ester carboxylesterase